MKFCKHIFLMGLNLWSISSVMAQSLINGFMQGKGKGSAVMSYYTESYIRVYQPSTNSSTTVNSKVKSNIASLFTTFGLSKKVDL